MSSEAKNPEEKCVSTRDSSMLLIALFLPEGLSCDPVLLSPHMLSVKWSFCFVFFFLKLGSSALRHVLGVFLSPGFAFRFPSHGGGNTPSSLLSPVTRTPPPVSCCSDK